MKEDKSNKCTPEEAKRFRSGFGSVLYLSQDRVDAQFATKSFVSSPTQQAVKCRKHLILYLKGPLHGHSYVHYVSEGQAYHGIERRREGI